MRLAGPAHVVRHYGGVALPAAHETGCQYVGLGSGVVCGPGVGEGGVLEISAPWIAKKLFTSRLLSSLLENGSVNSIIHNGRILSNGLA
jgi:hypothetical protein